MNNAIDGGPRLPSVTIELYDPLNSNPYQRKQVLIIGLWEVWTVKSHVDLSVGAQFQGYRIGNGVGLMVRYLDKKGHIKGELHQVVGEL